MDSINDKSLSARSRAKIRDEIARVSEDLEKALIETDPIKRPVAVFDPGNPRTIGFFIALALTAQPRVRMSEMAPRYGAGVYAIYYRGRFPEYAPIRGTETPIYVGQAAPGNQNAITPSQQGVRLSARLNEHRKNIEKTDSLNVGDFDVRTLTIQTGWETGAENYLIRQFRPIWNKETKLVYGIGKHGDSADTRGNRRSPWDTLHPGRGWAADTAKDQRSKEVIRESLAKHFRETRVFKDFDSVLAAFVEALAPP